MKQFNEIKLADKTTFRVGGIARNLYIPQSPSDACELIKKLHGVEYYVLSGGSNLLINDKKVFSHVIHCSEMDLDMTDWGEGRFYIGASNRIQNVISYVNKQGYGGFEELVSLPALFGGIVYMNAGIGGGDNEKFSISNFVTQVKCIERNTGKIVWIPNEQCQFAYRSSVFKKNEYLILGAEIQLNPQKTEVSQERIKKRKEYCKNHQEWGHGCFGSCFSKCDWKVLGIWKKLVKILFTDIRVDSHNTNWIINDGHATFASTYKSIKLAKFLHKLLHLECEAEVVIWE